MKIDNVAFFGPAGSHTEAALIEHLKPERTKACLSIAEVFSALSQGEADFGFVPLENMLQGPVTETLDQLFEHREKIFIHSSYLSEISHCLGVLPTADSSPLPKDRIELVYSHEQALRQCSKYLHLQLPNAEICQAPNTAAAANLVRGQNLTNAAVIAAKETLLQNGFIVIEEQISDYSGNKTRFALLGRGSVSDLAATETEAAIYKEEDLEFITSIVVDPGRDRQGLLFEILQVISIQNGVNLVSIHSRPDTKGGFVFHLDLEGSLQDDSVRKCLEALHRYCSDTTGKSAEIVVCGSYPRERFRALPFRRIGIIGGEGKMGRWFSNFFTQATLDVLISDKERGLLLEQLVARSDIIILSVPMSQISEIVRKICPLLRPGQLVVENCSIKSCALPGLVELTPPGVEVLGLHTMFAADIPSIKGENIIITPTEKSGKLAKALEDLLYKYGAMLSYASVEEHDKYAAFLQALNQLVLISLADVMRDSFSSLKELDPFSTPNSRQTLQTMKRVLSQSEELIVDLQTLNSQYPDMRHRFLATVSKLINALDEKDVETLLATVRSSSIFLNS